MKFGEKKAYQGCPWKREGPGLQWYVLRADHRMSIVQLMGLENCITWGLALQ